MNDAADVLVALCNGEERKSGHLRQSQSNAILTVVLEERFPVFETLGMRNGRSERCDAVTCELAETHRHLDFSEASNIVREMSLRVGRLSAAFHDLAPLSQNPP